MSRILIAGIIFWAVVFYVRIIQIGGIDPTYQEKGNQSLQSVRTQLGRIFGQVLPYPQSALISGIVLGQQSNLPYRLKQDLKATSTIHIVVVSGQNLTILAGFVMSLATWLGRRKTIVLTLLIILGYSLLTGLQIPVIRAGIMAVLVYSAQLLGKEGVSSWVLFLTAAFMLIINPNWLLSISFQLSFLATFGVVVVAPILIKLLEVVPKLLKEDLAVTLAAQVMVTPIIAYNFNQLSLVGILVNCLILWTIPLVMVIGGLCLIVGWVSMGLGQVIGLVPGVLLTYFVYLVEFFARLPGAGVSVGETPWIMWFGYYLLLAGIVWGMRIGIREKIDDKG